MEERRHFLTVTVGGLFLAGVLGGSLYFQKDSIAKKREEIAQVEVEISQARSLIETTTKLEDQVIVHRETDEVVATILPNDQDVLNFVRTLQQFQEASGVRFTSIKDKSQPATKDAKKLDFQRVGYTVQFDGDCFELLSFLNQVESHERFMRVPSFKLKAAARQSLDERGNTPRHSIDLEVETYVYAPSTTGKPAEIEDYDDKRDLLRARISARQRELLLTSYDYGGPRSRRDPWVDPRVPAEAAGTGRLTIEQQLDIVDGLIQETKKVSKLMDSWQISDNLIAEMKARGELESRLASLESEVRRLETEKQLLFQPAERRFQLEVVLEVERIRKGLEAADGAVLPTAMLEEAVKVMYTHMSKREYQLALDAYKGIEGRIEVAKIDELKRPYVERLREYASQARTVLEFERLDLDIGCIVDLGPDQRTVMINGHSYWPGEVLAEDTLVKTIDRTTVTFIYKGVVLQRSLGATEKP